MKINNDNDDVHLKAEYEERGKGEKKVFHENYTESEELHMRAQKKMSQTDREILRHSFAVNSKTGQENIEKSLLIHFIQMIYTAAIIYIFLLELSRTFLFLYLASGFVDIILMTFYIYFLIKFRSNEVISNISRNVFTASDYVNFANLIFKTFNISLLFSFASGLTVTFYLCFGFKYLLDFYFCLLSLKLFMFCPCSVWLNNALYSCFRWIKFKLFCCLDDTAVHEEDHHKKNEVLESNY